MNQDFSKIWVEAMRSGKYKQYQGALRSIDGYCCIGVGCDAAGLPWDKCGPSLFMCMGQSASAPHALLNASGISGKTGRLSIRDRNDCEVSLVDLNDTGFSFNQIADVIAWEAGI